MMLRNGYSEIFAILKEHTGIAWLALFRVCFGILHVEADCLTLQAHPANEFSLKNVSVLHALPFLCVLESVFESEVAKLKNRVALKRLRKLLLNFLELQAKMHGK